MKEERTDAIGFGGLTLVQRPGEFCYGIDAVLLADFAAGCRKKPERVADLGTGTGIIPLILSHKTGAAMIAGVEIQEQASALAEKNVRNNSLEGRISILNADIRELPAELKGTMDMVTANPPYIAQGKGLKNSSDAVMYARHEITAGLCDFMEASAWLLRDRGDLYMVHRPFRLADIFCFARDHHLEPKEMKLVQPVHDQPANIVLMHFVKGGGSELKLLPSICVYGPDGGYSEEIRKIYERV